MSFRLEDKISIAEKEYSVGIIAKKRSAKFIFSKADKNRMISTLKNSPYYNKVIQNEFDSILPIFYKTM